MGKNKRAVQEVNAGSMADIAFLLLIFFLVTTTMDSEAGLTRKLPEPLPENIDQPKVDIKERNIFTVLLNSKNQLLVQNKHMDVSQLKDAAKNFIQNPGLSDDLPEVQSVDVDNFGTTSFNGKYDVSKGVVSLQNDNGTQYAAYVEVQDILQQAYNEARDEFVKSLPGLGDSYEELSNEDKAAIRKIIPQRISEAEPKQIGK